MSVERRYPLSRRSDVVDHLHDVAVPDPYRWLEDAHSEETRQWVDAQNALTRQFLDSPHRATLVQRLTKGFDRARVTDAIRRGERYFFRRNTGLQAQAALFVQDGARATPRVLIDPNTFS